MRSGRALLWFIGSAVREVKAEDVRKRAFLASLLLLLLWCFILGDAAADSEMDMLSIAAHDTSASPTPSHGLLRTPWTLSSTAGRFGGRERPRGVYTMQMVEKKKNINRCIG